MSRGIALGGHYSPCQPIAFTQANDEIRPILNKLNAINREVHDRVKEGSTLWQAFKLNNFETAMFNMKNAIKFSIPHAVCPYCSGDGGIGSKCKGCQGSGWVNKLTYQGAPEDLK